MAELNRTPREGSSPTVGRIGTEREPSSEPKPGGQCQFEVFLQDQAADVPSGSSGSGWRWQLCSSSGAVLAQSGSYGTDLECLAAISSLRIFAASARLVQRD
jgi:uncharacterized protein YegP (UPF0339 family)